MVDEVIKFFVNREHHWSLRVSVLTFIALFFCIAELTTGLVSIFINSQRVDLLLKLNTAIQAAGSDKPTMEFLVSAKKAIVDRGPFPSFTFSDIAAAFHGLFQKNDFSSILVGFAASIYVAHECLTMIVYLGRRSSRTSALKWAIYLLVSFSIMTFLLVGVYTYISATFGNILAIILSMYFGLEIYRRNLIVKFRDLINRL